MSRKLPWPGLRCRVPALGVVWAQKINQGHAGRLELWLSQPDQRGRRHHISAAHMPRMHPQARGAVAAQSVPMPARCLGCRPRPANAAAIPQPPCPARRGLVTVNRAGHPRACTVRAAHTRLLILSATIQICPLVATKKIRRLHVRSAFQFRSLRSLHHLFLLCRLSLMRCTIRYVGINTSRVYSHHALPHLPHQ